ncbi:cold-shock protein [Skermania piniformis]|uniref:cold-shock protein n=1 Tax=Skermania pinensis TaxID=39122 RepID=UPI001FE49051|nr:cold shock domain-containing protein [Skermania piniformis]
MAETWETGRIVRFDHERGYGFIAPESGGEDLFVHTNDLLFEKALARPGIEVRFRAEDSDRGGKATDVELRVRDAAPREAIRMAPAAPVAAVSPAAVSAGDGASDILTEPEFLAEVTEVLLNSSSELRAGQMLEIRTRLLRLADEHGWIGD